MDTQQPTPSRADVLELSAWLRRQSADVQAQARVACDRARRSLAGTQEHLAALRRRAGLAGRVADR
jgi:hypothetical protein